VGQLVLRQARQSQQPQSFQSESQTYLQNSPPQILHQERLNLLGRQVLQVPLQHIIHQHRRDRSSICDKQTLLILATTVVTLLDGCSEIVTCASECGSEIPAAFVGIVEGADEIIDGEGAVESKPRGRQCKFESVKGRITSRPYCRCTICAQRLIRPYLPPWE
jgi:hypothetical protein